MRRSRAAWAGSRPGSAARRSSSSSSTGRHPGLRLDRQALRQGRRGARLGGRRRRRPADGADDAGGARLARHPARRASPGPRSPSGWSSPATPTAVALNGFLPANIGTLVMLVMFTTLLAGATFTAMLSGLVVQKIPFSVFNIASTSTSSSRSAARSRSSSASSKTTPACVVLIVDRRASSCSSLLARVFWEKLAGLRAQLLTGGAILRPAPALPAQGRAARARQLRRAPGDRRRLPRRLRDPRHLPQRRHRHRLQLDLQQRLGDARRRRRHPGDELDRALGRDRRRRPRPPTRSASSWSPPPGTWSSRSSSSPGSSAGPAARRWSGPPTRTPR